MQIKMISKIKTKMELDFSTELALWKKALKAIATLFFSKKELENMYVKYLKAEMKHSKKEKTGIRYEKYKRFNVILERGNHERES